MDEDLAPFLTTGLLVADEGGAVAGYVAFAPDGDTMHLSTVAVEPRAQGQGLGRALVAAVEREARAARLSWVSLYTNDAMTDNAALYPRLGYREVARRSEAGFDRIYFEKPVPPAMALKGTVDGLYGRRRTQNHRGDQGYDAFALDLSEPLTDPARLFRARVERVRLEVGFGGGEHLIHGAARCPAVGFIGVEPFETGMMKAVRAAKDAQLNNLRLFMGDARGVLEALPEAALERVDILYPDPWPKQRHWKRRFISMDGLSRLARVLPVGGAVRVASDIVSYVEWTRAHVAAHPAFELVGDSAEPWDGWPGTRYEAKALREGRPPRYLSLQRVQTER